MGSTLQISLLGNFLVRVDGVPQPQFEMSRLQSFLAYLLLHRDVPQPRSRLAFVLWPDSTDTQALANLRNLIHKLRLALPDADAFLHIRRQTLQWQPKPGTSWTLDVLEFAEALGKAEHVQDTSVVRKSLECAVGLYHGDLLPTCYDEWIVPERDRFQQMFFQILQKLITLLEQERDYEAAITAALRLQRYDSLREETYRQLMHLYAIQGDRASALRAYHSCASILERELGVEPSAATRSAYEQLVQSREAPDPLVASSAALRTATPLVGRKSEWTLLQEAWQRAISGQPHLVIVTGEAGIGKSRLAEELRTWVSRQGMTTASARSYEAEGALAYAPVVTWFKHESLQAGLQTLPDLWLTEVARLVPDLLLQRPDLPRPTPIRESWQRQCLFEALIRAILDARQPLLLVLDDLQWTDQETLAWLHYLLRFDPRARFLLVGTIRMEEIIPEHPLTSWIASLQRESLITQIMLRPLDAVETMMLAEHVAGQHLASSVKADLYRETEGNPLFVVETVRAGTMKQQDTGQLISLLSRQSPSQLPPTVQMVLMTRLMQLAPATRELASVAAVIGRAFTMSVLLAVSGSDEDIVVQGMDELWQRRIVREQGADAYDFSHDKLREVAYAALSAGKRRLLHRRVAESLATIYESNLDTVSGQVAAHYELAGLPEKALLYHERAGEAAMRIYANAEALASFQRAITILDVKLPLQHEHMAYLGERMGDILYLTGGYDAAMRTFQSVMSLVSAQDHIWHSRLYRKIARIWNGLVNSKEGLHAYQRAEAALDQVALSEQNFQWQQEWLQVKLDHLWPLYILARVDEMTSILEQIQPMIEEQGTANQRGYFFQYLFMRNCRRDRYRISEETLAFCQASLSANQESGILSEIATSQYMLATCLMWHDELEAAEEQMQAALTLAQQIGDLSIQLLCRAFMTVLFRKQKQVEKVKSSVSGILGTHSHIYDGMASAAQAWVAWKEGRYADVQAYAQTALLAWEPTSIIYPYQWTALWPLIGVALSQDHISDVMNYARMLLFPTQESLPDQLTQMIEVALQAWDSSQTEMARSSLQEAIALAEEMGCF